MTPEMLDAALAEMTPDDLDHIAGLLRDRAARQRRRLTLEEARVAVRDAEVSDAWLRSIVVDIGRLRRATCELVLAGWRPEQVAYALAQVGVEDCFPDGQTIALAIARGIDDARRLRW